jgi:hypothetical protein
MKFFEVAKKPAGAGRSIESINADLAMIVFFRKVLKERENVNSTSPFIVLFCPGLFHF